MTDPSRESYLLALDIGGTKVAAAVVTQQGQVVLRQEQPTCQLGPQTGIEQMAGMLLEMLEGRGLETSQVLGLGVGIPAVLEAGSDRVIWAPNLQGWRDVDLRPALESRLGLPVYIEYDGHTAVLGEWWQGAGRGYRSLAVVIIGTGIGGGMILDGRLYRGRDRLAGAVGWFALTGDPYLPEPRSRSIGHWESLAAGPGLAQRAAEQASQHPESGLYPLAQSQALTARSLFETARAGDALAKQLVLEAAGLIGLGVANLVSAIDPEIVILGGSVGAQGDLLLPSVREVVRRWAQPASASSTRIVCSELGADAGLFGAAYTVLMRGHPSGISDERS